MGVSASSSLSRRMWFVSSKSGNTTNPSTSKWRICSPTVRALKLVLSMRMLLDGLFARGSSSASARNIPGQVILGTLPRRQEPDDTGRHRRRRPPRQIEPHTKRPGTKTSPSWNPTQTRRCRTLSCNHTTHRMWGSRCDLVNRSPSCWHPRAMIGGDSSCSHRSGVCVTADWSVPSPLAAITCRRRWTTTISGTSPMMMGNTGPIR